MLLGTLGSSLLGNLLTGRGVNRARKGKEINRAGKGIEELVWKQNGFLIRPHSLTNFEIRKYYQNESRFNGVFSRDNLPERSFTEVNDEAYIINLD